MSASERDVAHELVCRLECILYVRGAEQDWMRATRIVREAIATARAEGETAGYAKGRREAFLEAATMFPVGWHGAADIAAALRAKADAEAPHE